MVVVLLLLLFALAVTIEFNRAETFLYVLLRVPVCIGIGKQFSVDVSIVLWRAFVMVSNFIYCE